MTITGSMSMAEFYYQPLTYEDCGLLGGRTIFNSGAEFILTEGSDIHDFAGRLVVEAQNDFQEDHIYPFDRIMVCLILLSHDMVFAYTTSDDRGNSTFSYRDVPLGNKDFDPHIIADYMFGTQLYDILVQVDKNVFKVVSYRTPSDNEKFGRAYDVFRCLDIRGTCIARETVNDELGQDYYLEAYDNIVTQTREYWIGREFAHEKYLAASFTPGEDMLGFFDENGNLIIDEEIAGFICKLAIKQEYIFINNEYQLDSRGIDMDKL